MGQTNILQHKSWHVYNKKNIEKVQKDEEKAQQEEMKKVERVMVAERESRIALLRQRAERRQISNQETQAETESSELVRVDASRAQPQASTGHINFWEEMERDAAAANKFAKNPEAEAEQKAQNEKWERQVTMYLDTGVKERAPWYSVLKESAFQPHSREDSVKKEKAQKKDDRTKNREDPLAMVQKYLKQDEGKEGRRKSSSSHKNSNSHRHKDQRKHSKDDDDDDDKDKIRKLREERLARERQERAKAVQVLTNGRDGDERGVDERDPSYRYHSQFNPKATQQARVRWTDTAGHADGASYKHRHRPY